MICGKLSVLAILVILAISTPLVTSEVRQTVYIKATLCKVNEKLLYKNISCFAKSYSRTFSASFMYMLAKAPITEDLKITITLFYKYGTIFRDVIRAPALDICSLLKNLQHTPTAVNLFVRTLTDVINDTVPGLIHECPYYGLFVKNASWNLNSVPAFFASGEYRIFFNGTIKNVYAGSVNVLFVINSPEKNTFG